MGGKFGPLLIDGPPLMASYVLSPHVRSITQPILAVERLALFKKNKAIISLFLECRFKQVKST